MRGEYHNKEDRVKRATVPDNLIDLATERAILGAYIKSEGLAAVGGNLVGDDFGVEAHQRIWGIIEEMLVSSLSVNVVRLARLIARDEQLTVGGSTDYMHELTAVASEQRDLPKHIEVLKDLAQRRIAYECGKQLQELAMDEDSGMSSPEMMAKTETILHHRHAESDTEGGGLKDMSSTIDETLEFVDACREGGVAGVQTGYAPIDDIIGGLGSSNLIILGARPGMGKTALAVNIANNIARQDKSVAFFSLEMEATRLVVRMVAGDLGIAQNKIYKGKLSDEEYTWVKQHSDATRKTKLKIDDTSNIHLAHLISRARRAHRISPLSLVVVDYLQLITVQRQARDRNRVLEVTEITSRLKGLAKELDVPVLALSQLSRKLTERPNKRPQAADLRDSGSIEQDADVVMFLHRPEEFLRLEEPAKDSTRHGKWQENMDAVAGLAEIIVSKNRHGGLGVANLMFDHRRTRFEDPAAPKKGRATETDEDVDEDTGW